MEIQFLRNNLDRLTDAHKRLFRDHIELRCECSKQEALMATLRQQNKALKSELRDTKRKHAKYREHGVVQVNSL